MLVLFFGGEGGGGEREREKEIIVTCPNIYKKEHVLRRTWIWWGNMI